MAQPYQAFAFLAESGTNSENWKCGFIFPRVKQVDEIDVLAQREYLMFVNSIVAYLLG